MAEKTIDRFCLDLYKGAENMYKGSQMGTHQIGEQRRFPLAARYKYGKDNGVLQSQRARGLFFDPMRAD